MATGGSFGRDYADRAGAMRLPFITVPDRASTQNFERLQGLLSYQFVGVGDPDGVDVAPVGATFHRRDGGAGTGFYVKESGSGASGWVAK